MTPGRHVSWLLAFAAGLGCGPPPPKSIPVVTAETIEPSADVPAPEPRSVAVESKPRRFPPVVDVDAQRILWTPYAQEVVNGNLERGRPVFLVFTADWCANCKANEKVFIETDTIRGDLIETNILPMKADFTHEDAEIEKMIEDLGRAEVPIYVIITPDGKRNLLPEVINTEMLSKALQEASARFPPDAYGSTTTRRGR